MSTHINPMDVATADRPVYVGPARLVRITDPDWSHAGGGTVTYQVFLGDRWVGWVGDGREFTGSRFGARRWWACWRQYDDTAARWDSGLTHPTRPTAVRALAGRACHGPTELVHLAATRPAVRRVA